MDPEDVPLSPPSPPVTKDWLESAYEWSGKHYYGAEAYYDFEIYDGSILQVHHSGECWIKQSGQSEEYPIGCCDTQRQLHDLVSALRSMT
jgi:hypothetical protein